MELNRTIFGGECWQMMAESGPSPVTCPNGMTVNWDQGKDILSIFVVLIPLRGAYQQHMRLAWRKQVDNMVTPSLMLAERAICRRLCDLGGT